MDVGKEVQVVGQWILVVQVQQIVICIFGGVGLIGLLVVEMDLFQLGQVVVGIVVVQVGVGDDVGGDFYFFVVVVDVVDFLGFVGVFGV